MNHSGRDRDLARTTEGDARGAATRRAFLQGVGGLWLTGAMFGGLAGRATAADQGPRLRPGHAQTPEEAIKELEEFKASYSDLAGWEKRKGIRQGILEGARLSPLPEKTPLKPMYLKKRVYDGYSAQSVAIQSWPGFYVTGTLYRPLDLKPPYAAVLSARSWRAIPAGQANPLRPSSPAWERSSSITTWSATAIPRRPAGPTAGSEVLRTITWNSIRSMDFLESIEGWT